MLALGITIFIGSIAIVVFVGLAMKMYDAIKNTDEYVIIYDKFLNCYSGYKNTLEFKIFGPHLTSSDTSAYCRLEDLKDIIQEKTDRNSSNRYVRI